MPAFRHHHRVTYASCTVGNHVYHSRFLDLLETARGEFFRALGTTFLDWQNRGFIFPVIACQLSFKAPARYDTVLHIDLWVTHAAGVRLNFAYRITTAEGALVLEGTTDHVCTNLNDKPRRLPPELVTSLHPVVASRPEPQNQL